MKPVKLALIGAGQRGMNAYGPYASKYPGEAVFAAVAEPDDARREEFKKRHALSDKNCFTGWEEMLENEKMSDAVLICTQDKMHYKPVINSLEKGYHVLLEKPMATTIPECISMVECSRKNGKILSICHVLRFTPFFSAIKQLLNEGKIGRLISIQHNENVGYWHQAHSFVRGNWSNSQKSSPMILAKSCHDMDILYWLADARPAQISSFGKLTRFKKENCPESAPDRCFDGCPVKDECKYYAPDIYLSENTEWPASVISAEKSYEARKTALLKGPYGRCVYKCDNDVVDHQVVSILFENEVTASFTMCAFTNRCSRTIKLMGTEGEIRGYMEKNELEVINFKTNKTTAIKLDCPDSKHGGGDFSLMRDFVGLVDNGGRYGLTSAKESLTSHFMAFAAEKSRIESIVIHMEQYEKGYYKSI